ncbi:hypothetical protein NDU88_004246 [Pleurodeles waltl]|uniref:Uncharacterized protein n=1 Tax=Pleurodeles waltl TaxID=8319 RepID=A0AAV7RIS8_PLEWA|nr:hypothetical protein NDU88_004246 [Pleurodeles waltl]
MFPRVASMCLHCAHHDVTFLHMLWECLPLVPIRVQVMEHVAEILEVPLTPDPLLFLLGITEHTKDTKHYLKLTDLQMALFNRLRAVSWKVAQSLEISCWLQVVLKLATVESDAISCDLRTQGEEEASTLWDFYVI